MDEQMQDGGMSSPEPMEADARHHRHDPPDEGLGTADPDIDTDTEVQPAEETTGDEASDDEDLQDE